MLTALLAAAALATTPPAPPVVVDGTIGKTEWAGAKRERLTGGGEVLLLRSGTTLYVAVQGAATGFPTLCVGNGDRIKILHASAALGEVVYTRKDGTWQRGKPFEWLLRDGRAPKPEAEKQKFLADFGWLATASNTGAPAREFRIDLGPGKSTLGVAFLSTDTMAAAYWPSTMADGCRATELLRGDPPDTMAFEPTQWHPLE